ncbi:Serine racemase [Ceraceosorus bombacis]|uniref:Serine racemase n=1 Tax=Ceraceosorus bombacis TaxID=401625 RepID=A0A0P1BRC3_9BASI|nr:Serine racemase [Ceraceosorus bombacis]
MPNNAPLVKQSAVRGYGAVVHLCEPTLAARENTAEQVLEDLRAQGYQATFVHPYDEPWVIEGQGTLALEMYEQVQMLEHRPGCSHAASTGTQRENAWLRRSDSLPRCDFVIGPVGGGGMMSGSSTALKELDARIDVRAAEPLGADDASRSFQSGNVEPAIVPAQTICDGLLTALSSRTLSILQSNVTCVHLVDDASTLRANRLLLERLKQVVEPSAATSLAVVLSNKDFQEAVRQKTKAIGRLSSHESSQSAATSQQGIEIRIGCILTGGNVELGKLIQAIDGAEG